MSRPHDELADFIASEVRAENIARFRFSEEVKARVSQLAKGEKQGQLSEEERLEFEQYKSLEHLRELTKAKAKQKMRTVNRFQFANTDDTVPRLWFAVKPELISEFVFWIEDESIVPDWSRWKRGFHQCGGYLCNQFEFVGVELSPRKTAMHSMRELELKYLGSFLKHNPPPTIEQLIEYKHYLRENMGVDCNKTHQHLAEAVYPIDCTEESVRTLVEGRFVIEDVLQKRKHLTVPYATWEWDHFVLLVLGRNSD